MNITLLILSEDVIKSNKMFDTPTGVIHSIPKCLRLLIDIN